jgi:hypothetical protein
VLNAELARPVGRALQSAIKLNQQSDQQSAFGNQPNPQSAISNQQFHCFTVRPVPLFSVNRRSIFTFVQRSRVPSTHCTTTPLTVAERPRPT